jgi:hypothetical protein
MDPPLLFTARHAVLRVWLPRHAPGTSPAAKALHLVSRATVGDLVETAAGHGIR